MTKEFIGTASNISFYEDDEDEMQSYIETVIIYTEPTYEPDLDGTMTRLRKTDSFRFSASPGGLRKLARVLEASAREAEYDLNRLILE